MEQQQYSLDHIPSVFVATKSDLDLAQQRHEVQPDVYARRLGLPVPMSVSVKLGTCPSYRAIIDPYNPRDTYYSLPSDST